MLANQLSVIKQHQYSILASINMIILESKKMLLLMLIHGEEVYQMLFDFDYEHPRIGYR
jgi:hypothetical protein